MKLSTALRQAIKRYTLLPPHTSLIVAVSGGVDSLALLHCLVQEAASLKLQVACASFNHQLRPQASADVAHVAELAARWGVTCYVGQAEVTMLARQWQMGIEAAARRARYEFLAQLAQAQAASAVVTAHHADDHAETILLHLVRGSGLRGLEGLRWSAPLPYAPPQTHLRLIRPLLGVRKAQLETYCAQQGILPRVDESNADLHFRRNYVRHELVPRLQALNPAWQTALSRLASSAQMDADFIQQAYQQQVVPFVETGEREGHAYQALPKPLFKRLHQALALRWIYQAAQALGTTDDLGYERLLAAYTVAQAGKTGKQVELPHGLRVQIERLQVCVVSGLG